MIGDKASIHPSTISHLPNAGLSEHRSINHVPISAFSFLLSAFSFRPVNRLLVESVPLACEVERFDPQAPPWEAVSVRVHTLKHSKTVQHAV